MGGLRNGIYEVVKSSEFRHLWDSISESYIISFRRQSRESKRPIPRHQLKRSLGFFFKFFFPRADTFVTETAGLLPWRKRFG